MLLRRRPRGASLRSTSPNLSLLRVSRMSETVPSAFCQISSGAVPSAARAMPGMTKVAAIAAMPTTMVVLRILRNIWSLILTVMAGSVGLTPLYGIFTRSGVNQELTTDTLPCFSSYSRASTPSSFINYPISWVVLGRKLAESGSQDLRIVKKSDARRKNKIDFFGRESTFLIVTMHSESESGQ